MGSTSRRSAPRHLAHGLLMGGADIIPGVSGGTMALIVGIYEDLIDAIRDVAHAGLAAVRGDRREAAATFRRVPWLLVLPLGLGILTALAIGTVVIEPLLERFPAQTSALFAGLILGALPIPWRRVRRRGPAIYAAALIAGLGAFWFAGLTESTPESPSLLMVFGAAAIAICAMILPGISGAYLLLILGMYRPTLQAARDFDVAYVATFAMGAVVGLGSFSKLLSWLLDHRHDVTMAVLVGLMAGSLRRLWPWQTEQGALVAAPGGGEVALAVAMTLVGLVAVVALERSGRRSTERSAVGAGS